MRNILEIRQEGGLDDFLAIMMDSFFFFFAYPSLEKKVELVVFAFKTTVNYILIFYILNSASSQCTHANSSVA